MNPKLWKALLTLFLCLKCAIYIDASISLQKHCGSSPQLQFLMPHIHINLNA